MTRMGINRSPGLPQEYDKASKSGPRGGTGAVACSLYVRLSTMHETAGRGLEFRSVGKGAILHLLREIMDRKVPTRLALDLIAEEFDLPVQESAIRYLLGRPLLWNVIAKQLWKPGPARQRLFVLVISSHE